MTDALLDSDYIFPGVGIWKCYPMFPWVTFSSKIDSSDQNADHTSLFDRFVVLKVYCKLILLLWL
jgi:hypothetical protein